MTAGESRCSRIARKRISWFEKRLHGTCRAGSVLLYLAKRDQIGMARSLAIYTFPEFEVVVPYLIMVLVLLIRPYGLFTVAQARKI